MRPFSAFSKRNRDQTSAIVVAGRAARSGEPAEVRFHIEMETEKYVRQGMAPAEPAVARSGIFGPVEKHKEETRDARGLMWIEELIQDVRYSGRAFIKSRALPRLPSSLARASAPARSSA